MRDLVHNECFFSAHTPNVIQPATCCMMMKVGFENQPSTACMFLQVEQHQDMSVHSPLYFIIVNVQDLPV